MQGKLGRAREALKVFVQTSHNDDDFFLIGFNQRADLLAEFTDGVALLNKLSLTGPQGETALYEAVYLGLEKVKQGRHRRHALLLISDGQDNASHYSYGELRKLLQEANLRLVLVEKCHGLVPWIITFAATQAGNWPRMPRACPVEVHVRSYCSPKREPPRDKPVASTHSQIIWFQLAQVVSICLTHQDVDQPECAAVRYGER